MRSLVARLSLLVCISSVTFLASAQQPLASPRIVERIDEARRTVLRGNTHRLARPQFDRGAAPPELPMKRMLLVLKRSPEQEQALRELLDDQQDKNSASYHKWLTPTQFGQQFGPASQDIETVKSWLQSHGFEIGNVARGGNLIEFSGVARQVREAFHTSIHRYVVNGEEHWANANDPEIPVALTPVVAGIHTLHNFVKKPMLHVAEEKIPAQVVDRGPGKPPQVTFSGNLHGLSPADVATIYNVSPLYQESSPIDGTNQSIAVVGRTEIDLNNLALFFGLFGVYANSYRSIPNGPSPGNLGGGEELEATLDMSWANALAPRANVYLIVSATTNTTDGVDLSEAWVVDNGFSHIMTESFGSCEALFTSTEAEGFSTLAEQAAAEGITYLVSSGDSGAEGCDNPNVETTATGPLSVNMLASTPFNLAVGGTMFNENGQDSKYWNSNNDPNNLSSAKSYIPENVWNESCTASQCGDAAGIWAGGGGASSFFTKPSWQAGVRGIPNDGWRDVPDISLSAAGHDPYLLCLLNSCIPDNQGRIYFYAVAGTSASAPTFAGIMALVNQKNSIYGQGQGQVAYVLYKLAAAENWSQCNGSDTSKLPASTCIFNDTTKGNNAVPGETGYGNSNASYQSGAGYDLATGLGSVNVTNLVNKWSTVTFRATTITVDVSPTTLQHGQPANIDIVVAPKSGGGIPTGDAIVTAYPKGVGQALGPFTINNGSASPVVNDLPGGVYSLTAHYGGDAIYAPSNSFSSPQIHVTPEPSVVTLTALTLDSNYHFVPFSSLEYGRFIYYRADVNGQSGQGRASGRVSFQDDQGFYYLTDLNRQGNAATRNFFNSRLGNVPVGIFNLSVGSHVVTASYQGDTSFTAGDSAPVNLTITPAIAKLTASATGATQGADFKTTINTNSAGDLPGGTVTYYVNGKSVGQAGLNATPATVDLTGTLIPIQAYTDFFNDPLANGSYTLQAKYSGDANYSPVASPVVKFTLKPDFAFSSNLDTFDVSPGGSRTLVLSIKALDGYSGTVTFSSSSCSGLPPGASCSFSSTSVKDTGATNLTVSTTAATAAVPRSLWPRRAIWWALASTLGLGGIVVLAAPIRRRRLTWLGTLMFCVCVLWIGCGGGSSGTSGHSTSSIPTPVGSYVVSVSATSGSLSHRISFTMNVK